MKQTKHILWFEEVDKHDTHIVGGKGSSLGEMSSVMPVPNGFCISVAAYKEVLKQHQDEFLKIMEKRDIENIEELERSVKRNVKKGLVIYGDMYE